MRSTVSGMGRREFLLSASRIGALGGLLTAGCVAPLNRVHVIGSGITGLCAGALLAKRGHEVHVLESHSELLGGHSAGFTRDGFRFCVGPQYVWDFRDDGIGMQVLRELGLEERARFDTLDPDGFEEIYIGDGLGVNVPMGLDRFRETAMDEHPDDCAGLALFFSYLRDLHEGTRLIERFGLYTQGEGAMMLAFLMSPDLPQRVKLRLGQCSRWSLAQLFDYCGLSQLTRRFLYGYGGIFLENESEVSCIAYAGATGNYHAGADYPRFGFPDLVQALADSIADSGGVVSKNKHVVGLRRFGTRITGILCGDGDEFATDCVISTAAPHLVSAMLQEPGLVRSSYSPSNSLISAFIGVRDYPQLPSRLARKNIWWQDGEGEVNFTNPDMTRPPRLLSVASPTSNGLHNTNPNPNDHSLIVFAPGNFNAAAEAFAQSPEAHDDLRSLIEEQLVERLEEQVFPNLRPYIRTVEVHTPHDLRQRARAELGNAYGRRLTPPSLLEKPYTLLGVSNLHIACASTGMPGIATAFQSAVLLTERIDRSPL